MDGTVLYFIVFINKEIKHRNQTIDRIRLGGIGTPHKRKSYYIHCFCVKKNYNILNNSIRVLYYVIIAYTYV